MSRQAFMDARSMPHYPWRSHMSQGTSFRTMIRIFAAASSIAVLSAATTARADDPAKVLKAMADYLSGQKSLSGKFDSDIEVITPELQKIQFTSSGEMKMNRPDKLRIRRTGGYADVELVYDGKTVSLYGNNAKSYVQSDLAGSIDQMIGTLQTRSGAGMPGADLLLSNSYDELPADATKVALDSAVMIEFDEIPPGTPAGAKK